MVGPGIPTENRDLKTLDNEGHKDKRVAIHLSVLKIITVNFNISS